MKNTSNKEIEQLNNRIKELEEGWKRSQADFENYRKRNEQDRINLFATANLDLIMKILPVMDNFRRSAQHVPEDIKDKDWTKGIELIEKHLESILTQEGLTKIETKTGDNFDPMIHEAISHEENKDFKSDQIIAVVDEGYKLGGKILRPAKVRVVK